MSFSLSFSLFHLYSFHLMSSSQQSSTISLSYSQYLTFFSLLIGQFKRVERERDIEREREGGGGGREGEGECIYMCPERVASHWMSVLPSVYVYSLSPLFFHYYLSQIPGCSFVTPCINYCLYYK